MGLPCWRYCNRQSGVDLICVAARGYEKEGEGERFACVALLRAARYSC